MARRAQHSWENSATAYPDTPMENSATQTGPKAEGRADGFLPERGLLLGGCGGKHRDTAASPLEDRDHSQECPTAGAAEERAPLRAGESTPIPRPEDP